MDLNGRHVSLSDFKGHPLVVNFWGTYCAPCKIEMPWLEELSKNVSLSDFKGKPLVVNFWGTYCAPCKIEMPWLEELSKKYAADGFEVLGVTYDSEVGKETISKDVK